MSRVQESEDATHEAATAAEVTRAPAQEVAGG